jgi:16S rRNA (guanine966-N2)-methyltransferase
LSRVAPPRRHSAQGEVRIVGGQWKRSKLQVPAVEGLRPTSDRVRETLFNWLGQDLTGLRCVDAFAGTGALGLEAASRGAAEVCCIEANPALAQGLRRNAERLGASQVRVQAGDAVQRMTMLPAGVWDVVFLDPPFSQAPGSAAGQGLFEQVLAQAVRLLAPQGMVYLEAPQAWTAEVLQPLGLEVWRQGKAGAVHYHLLQRAAAS